METKCRSSAWKAAEGQINDTNDPSVGSVYCVFVMEKSGRSVPDRSINQTNFVL